MSEPVLFGVAAPRAAAPASSFTVRFAAYIAAARGAAQEHLEKLGEKDDRVVMDIPPDREPRWRIGGSGDDSIDRRARHHHARGAQLRVERARESRKLYGASECRCAERDPTVVLPRVSRVGADRVHPAGRGDRRWRRRGSNTPARRARAVVRVCFLFVQGR